ncbi:translation initiation factor eIF-2B alpha subunit [Cavenderia fasciculata]|uniref:Methylthioribose-1-phosphate isomerase n=1 Tax=Cavenderia fasciculata TaxID=261658 RepID=F4QBM2_CACFS|nr:translation initiation factor eIF-2B alpha subunit [Cavenderia fasciculata]EGG14610.1 translation initiation factor eIF-2B alpha subunit [Cavenderia fasciculata]|eukprot:XP_004351118.1 translation initiation factor eIF-2B alpha subunit [Cavenderia fasciculata]
MLKDFEYLSIRYKDEKLEILDQRRLPDIEEWMESKTPEDMITYIKQLSVRGAPLIGVAASVALFVYVRDHPDADRKTIVEVSDQLRNARPTAVNLMNNIDTMIQLSQPDQDKRDYSAEKMAELAYSIVEAEVEMCRRMSEFGAELVQQGEGILTHCNTGGVATPGMGTALGVIRAAHRAGKQIHVYVDETRPLLQGGRLTTYELEREQIPYTLICDNMAATLMAAGKIQRVLVGADRIARNGDFANKIGTYSVAVLAKYHNIPFHGVAPWSTVDPACPSGKHIPIEQRAPQEVQGASGAFGSVRWAPKDSQTFNPAFDVTPNSLITSLILDTGVYDCQSFEKYVEQIKGNLS